MSPQATAILDKFLKPMSEFAPRPNNRVNSRVNNTKRCQEREPTGSKYLSGVSGLVNVTRYDLMSVMLLMSFAWGRVSPCRMPLASAGFDAATIPRNVNIRTINRRSENTFIVVEVGR